jgi:hypothetical protein
VGKVLAMANVGSFRWSCGEEEEEEEEEVEEK